MQIYDTTKMTDNDMPKFGAVKYPFIDNPVLTLAAVMDPTYKYKPAKGVWHYVAAKKNNIPLDNQIIDRMSIL